MARLSFFTLVLTAVVAQLSLTAIPSAHALQGMNLTPPMVRRAEHVDLNQRMIKKKRQTPTDDVPINPIADPTPSTNTSVTPTPTTPTPTPTPTTQVPPVTQAPPTRTTTTTSPPANTVTTTTTTGTSTTSSTTSSSSSSQTSVATSSTSFSAIILSIPTTTSSRTQSTVLVTQTAPAAAQASDASQDPGASFLPKSVIIGLIVAGSCIAAGAAIWTIIRKWKFSPSRHFEDRLEPINWEPTQASGLPHDPTVAALERASSQNGGGRGSLGSNDEHGQRNMTSVNHDQISMAPDFPPPHDFTAGTGGGYGQGAGYVDMHRGPSPAPGAYGAPYETPNPYDTYDYSNQAAYGQRHY